MPPGDTVGVGALLVATPRLVDPNFSGTVVLVCALDAGGGLGLVLDRPTAEPAARHLPAWGAHLATPGMVFVGGPVQPETAIGLVEADPAAVLPALSPVADGLGLYDLEAGPAEGITAVRVFSGYAGWGPGQLEEEVEAGDWFVLDLEPGDPLTADPSGLRERVLRRQGPPLSLYASYPSDPALN
jgi:putative transcriptional regulator